MLLGNMMLYCAYEENITFLEVFMRRAKVLSDQEIKRVLAVAANSGQWSARNRCLFLLSLRAGLRAGEIAALHISDGPQGVHTARHCHAAETHISGGWHWRCYFALRSPFVHHTACLQGHCSPRVTRTGRPQAPWDYPAIYRRE